MIILPIGKIIGNQNFMLIKYKKLVLKYKSNQPNILIVIILFPYNTLLLFQSMENKIVSYTFMHIIKKAFYKQSWINFNYFFLFEKSH